MCCRFNDLMVTRASKPETQCGLWNEEGFHGGGLDPCVLWDKTSPREMLPTCLLIPDREPTTDQSMDTGVTYRNMDEG